MAVKRALVAFLTVLAVPGCPGQQRAPKPAEAVFRKIQNLVGDWKGVDGSGQVIRTSFVPIAGSTAIMETLIAPGMPDMVTIYSLDVNSIALMHYCPTNNQPRMRAIPPADSVKELTFTFTGAGNLPDRSVGHEQKLLMRFDDNDHIVEQWTWQRAGKATETTFHLSRVHPAGK